MVATFSHTAVVAEPKCAKLRKAEAPELREARDFFSKPSWAALNAAFVYRKTSWAASNTALV